MAAPAVPCRAVAVQPARYLHGAVRCGPSSLLARRRDRASTLSCPGVALAVPSVTPRRPGVLLDLRSWPRGLSLFVGRALKRTDNAMPLLTFRFQSNVNEVLVVH